SLNRQDLRRSFRHCLAIFVPSVLFFVTHEVTNSMYLLSTELLVVGAVLCAILSSRVRTQKKSPLLALIAVVLGIWGIWNLWTIKPSALEYERAHRPQAVDSLPQELADSRAWIWADDLSGSFWYYFNRPAYKAHFGSKRVQAFVFQFARQRG